MVSGRRLLVLAAVVLLAACQPRASPDHSQTVRGIRFDYGLAPSAQVAEHLPPHVERSMHGGPRHGANVYHVTLALFDAVSGSRIDDATVSLRVWGPGHRHRFSIPLEPMTIASNATYGGYVTLPEGNYRFTFDAKRPSAPHVKATFAVGRPSP